MPILEIITLSVPQHWITPIVYGDTGGLDECEAGAFERWYQDMTRDVGHGKTPYIGRIKEESYFARYHDAAEYGVPACNCHDVDFLVEAVRHEPNDPVQDYVTANTWTTAAAIFEMENQDD